MRKILNAITAFFLALAALWFGYQHTRHANKRIEKIKKAEVLEKDKQVSVKEAAAARDDAKAELHAANAALAKGRANMKRTENRNEAIADRVARINKRLRGD